MENTETLKDMRFVDVYQIAPSPNRNPIRPCYHPKKQRRVGQPWRSDKRRFINDAYNVMCKDVSGWNKWGEHRAEYCQNCKFYGGLVFGGQVRCLYKEMTE